MLFYSVIFSLLYVFSARIALKVIKVRDPRFIGALYLIPMFIPLIMNAISFLLSFLKELRAVHLFPQIKNGIIFGDFIIRDTILRAIGSQYFFIMDKFSLAGLSFGIALFIFWYIFGSKVVCKLQGVVEITPQEQPELTVITKRLAQRAGIPMPRLGISEDLRPNAFTTGWGKNALIVVTLGLIKMLDSVELEAVIAHEIAHIKNQDFHFMALISSLKAISFFNPIVYVLSPTIKKERELLADSAGTALLERPDAFGRALTKIWENSKEFPRNFMKQWISGLFIISEIKHASNILAAHPTLESRLSNISEMRKRTKVNKGEVLRTILICGAVMAVMAFALGLTMRTYFSIWGVNNAPVGPDPFQHTSTSIPANRPTFTPPAYPPIMSFNLQGFLTHDYPWLLNTIEIAITLMILLKIWRPSINLHRPFNRNIL